MPCQIWDWNLEDYKLTKNLNVCVCVCTDDWMMEPQISISNDFKLTTVLNHPAIKATELPVRCCCGTSSDPTSTM